MRPEPLVHIPGALGRDITGRTSPTWVGTEAYTTGRRGRAAVACGSGRAVNLGALGLSEGNPQTLACWIRANAVSDWIISTENDTIWEEMCGWVRALKGEATRLG